MKKDRYSLYLCIAITMEIVATTLLALSKGMSIILPAGLALAAYAVSYFFLTLSLKKIPIGLAYALWAGVGIVATSITNRVVFDKLISHGSIIGMLLILAGVVVINLLSGKDKPANSVSGGR
ncbi:multidrug efflux SMR transporter [Pantoea sp. CCBC3-3-1]|uniref:DMT family transporter n=1 Tax=Pantoea sp. CCBC3-3-1 TaxID=2490851 RepID=UPI0011BED30E|nr:multidrug efflux SMR transporter [Pantoea sp. CCBC3-3-1]